MAILALGPSGKLPLDHFKGLWVDDGLMVILHVVLRDLTLIGFHLLGQIQEIVDNCGYSPATFYRHFKDKYDLIAWDYVCQSSKIMNKVDVGAYVWKDTLSDGIRFFLKNKEYMQNLLRNTSGHDAFIRHLSMANIGHLTKCILMLTGEKVLDPDREILVKIYCFGTVQTICGWLLDEIRMGGDHLSELFEQALPDALRDSLCKE